MKTIFVDVEINLIQQLRLIQALSESSCEVIVRPEDKFKFELLSQKFGMSVNTGVEGDLLVSQISEVHHKKPETSVGRIDRTLIFPHSIAEYCKSLWQNHRKYKFTFAGLVTKNRRNVITEWVKHNTTAKPSRLTNADSFSYKVRKKVFQKLGIDDSIYKELGELVIWSSTRGRKYPEKAWDDDYYSFLANSKFVLCPSGNSVWSYRFFESILCGSIPVIEEMCPAYEGFKFYKMQDNASNFVWDKDIVEYNYALCIQRNTIAKDLLDMELSQFLAKEY